MRSEKGLVRLDKETGEMVALNEYNSPSSVDLTYVREKGEIDPLLSVVKTFPVFDFPGTTRELKVKVDYRWRIGSMDYRFSLAPYADDLNGLLRDSANHLTLSFVDSDGFEVARAEAPLASLIRLVGPSKKPESWQSDDSLRISKTDFRRIVSVTYSWAYTAALNEALSKEPQPVKVPETAPKDGRDER